eukprot:10290513-Ditylum_brightwellii.AAC.1
MVNLVHHDGDFLSHRWSTSPPAQDTNYVHNLTAGIDFSEPFFPESTGDTSNNDEFLYHNNFLP